MDLEFGPFNGCRVVVSVVEGNEPAGSYCASYQIFANAAEDTRSGAVLRRAVAGAWPSADEASDIALQLARLQIATLREHAVQAADRAQRKATLAAFSAAWGADGEPEPLPLAFQPTLPSPLQPMA